VSYHLFDNILTTLNNKLLVGGIFCDLHKDFDCANYDTLLPKMEFYGITGKAYHLINSYLQGRYQRVLIDFDSNRHNLKWEPITVGFPQGSILGLLLLLLYINDLPKIISDQSNPVLYANDTSLVITNSNCQIFEKNINTVVSRLNRWFHSNSLLLNLENTYFLQFVTKNARTLDLQILFQNKHI
jgi:hypothetical protein